MNYTIIIVMDTLSKKFLAALLSVLLLFGTVFPSFAAVETTDNSFKNLLDKDILNLFKVTDSYASNKSENIIILIQDLHNDFATQEKIYSALNNLSEKQNFEIYGEGIVDNTLDVSLLNSIPDEKLRKETIDNLFKASVLSACEYFVLSDKSNYVKGLEDKKEYTENLLLLEKIEKNKNFNNYIIDNIIERVTELKQQNIIDRILSLQTIRLNNSNIPDKYPNLQKYQTVSKNLSSINSKKLNSQFKNFVKKSKDDSAVYNLLRQNSDYGYAQIYDYIDSKLPEFKENKKNKDFIIYLQSNKLLSEINTVSLLYEKEYYINGLLNKERLEQNERELINLGNYTEFLKDLVNVNILSSHYTLLKENKKYFTELLNKYLSNDLLAFALYLLNDKDLFDFFDTNINRNEIFVTNLLKDNTDKIAVVGGFHSDITKKLKEEKISYIVLTPNLNLTNAFNKLFSTTLKYGTDEQIASNILSIISSWRIFFTDIASFQKEINNWIGNNPELKDKLTIKIEAKDQGFSVDVNYADAQISKDFGTSQKTEKQVLLSKRQQNLTVDEIFKIAKQYYLFGDNVEIKVSEDDSLLDNIVPMRVETINGNPVIFVNRKFLKELYINPYLIQPAIKILYYSTAEITDKDSCVSFVGNNYEELQEIYNIKTRLKNTKSSLMFTVKTKFSKFINNIKAGIGNFNNIQTIKEVSDDEIKTEDERYMAEALKQAKLARQSRSFLTTFIQPPIGAYLINSSVNATKDDDGISITGRNFNRTDSVLHAETLTFIDFLKNCIRENKSNSDGELTEEGKYLMSLLELALINGESINKGVFQKRPYFLDMIIDHQIDYSENGKKQGKRNIDTVFDETNAVLEYVNEKLGKPLAGATLYCTLAPCNKCAKTMKTLGIHKLVFGSYSANKNHKSINTIGAAGIHVVGGILEKQCDERIVNYRFMNLSVVRTKIASFIQIVRRSFVNFLRATHRFLNSLIANLSFSETDSLLLTLRYNISYLQENIDWTDLQANPQVLDKLANLLKQFGAYDDTIKRASIIYVIKNKCSIKIENGNLVFYNKENKKLVFYINSKLALVMPKSYSDKMNELAKVRNFADLDDNFALRDKPFDKDVQAVVSTLMLFGIAQPEFITGNTLEKAEIRLKPLGNIIRDFIPFIYMENAALQGVNEGGEFKESDDYMINIADSILPPDMMAYLENLFAGMQDEYYNNLVYFVETIKPLREQQLDVKYDNFFEALSLDKQPYYEKYKTLLQNWGSLRRNDAKKRLNDIYRILMEEKVEPRTFKEIMKMLALFEFSRLYFSTDKQDQKEADGIKKAFTDGVSNNKPVSKVRYVVTAFRPTLVRELVAKYYEPVVREQYPELMVQSSGQTTIGIYKSKINKSIPLSDAIKKGTSPDQIIYTGDEFSEDGVDYPVYALQQAQNGQNKDMVVINTNGESFSGDFISLYKFEGFPKGTANTDNITRSEILQKTILEIVEQNIGAIATDDSEYEQKPVAQQLRERLDTLGAEQETNVVPFSEQEQQPEPSNIMDMLKAG